MSLEQRVTKLERVIRQLNNETRDSVIQIVLDKSGSMENLRDEMIVSYNKFIADQKKNNVQAKVSLTMFDTNFINVYDNKLLKHVPKLTRDTYDPSGSTALLDAVGDAIDRLVEVNPEKVVFVIVTDGEENSSHKFTLSTIKGKIERATRKGWQFVYLGSNQDAFAEAGGLGIPMASAGTWTYTGRGLGSGMSTGSTATSNYFNNNVNVDLNKTAEELGIDTEDLQTEKTPVPTPN